MYYVMGREEILHRTYMKKLNWTLGFLLSSSVLLCCYWSLVTSSTKVKGFLSCLHLFKYAHVHLLYVHISYSLSFSALFIFFILIKKTSQFERYYENWLLIILSLRNSLYVRNAWKYMHMFVGIFLFLRRDSIIYARILLIVSYFYNWIKTV